MRRRLITGGWLRRQPRPYLTPALVRAGLAQLDQQTGPAVRGSVARNRDRGATPAEREAWAGLVEQLENEAQK
jgi:hypothetical protein